MKFINYKLPPRFSPPERLLTNSFFSKLISAFYNYCHSCGEQSLSNDRIERTCWEISCFASKCAFVSKQPSRTDEEIGQTFDILKEIVDKLSMIEALLFYSESMHIKFYITMQF